MEGSVRRGKDILRYSIFKWKYHRRLRGSLFETILILSIGSKPRVVGIGMTLVQMSAVDWQQETVGGSSSSHAAIKPCSQPERVRNYSICNLQRAAGAGPR